MSPLFLSAASLVTLLMVAAGVSYYAKRWKFPPTVALVAAGIAIAYAAYWSPMAFLNDFELTPEILFYVFLPILLFESAYAIKYKELLRNVRAIGLLSGVSLIVSAFFIAFVLKFALKLIGIEVPLEIALLFGALISSTDTAAVLSIFKELGVPRRLLVIFEGESLFNDGTAIALFLVVLGAVKALTPGVQDLTHHSLAMGGLELFQKHFGDSFVVVSGIFSFASMVTLGIVFWAIVGILASKIVQKVRNDTNFEITLTLALAHATFLWAEAVNHFIAPVSGIIATVAAAMVLGNYGRYKISPKVEEVMEKYWSLFSFVSNSLVFLLVGMTLVTLDVRWQPLIVPVALAIPIVLLARAASVYPVLGLLHFSKHESPLPLSWQHVLSWGALRGGLAMMMVLLVPADLTVPGWSVPGTSVRDFLLSLTLGCVAFSVFVKAMTVGPLIRKFKIDALHEIEEFEYAEGRVLMASAAIEQVKKIKKAGYVDADESLALKERYLRIIDKARADAEKLEERKGERYGDLIRQVAALHALGIERHHLKYLYKYGEIPEPVFKKLMKRLSAQIRRVERGESQTDSANVRKGPKQDIFEQLTEFFVDRLEVKIDPVQEKYFELRTIHIVVEKALEGLMNLGEVEFVGGRPEFMEVVELYEGFRSRAEKERRELYRLHRAELKKLNSTLAEKSLLQTEEAVLEDLSAKDIVSPKLARRFEKSIGRRMYEES